MDTWKDIWANRSVRTEELESGAPERVFMELKRLTGNDTLGGEGVPYRAFVKWFDAVYQELTFPQSPDDGPWSFFEVGCGSGALLYLLAQRGPYLVGGLDYSKALVDTAVKILNGLSDAHHEGSGERGGCTCRKAQVRELYCAEAIALDTALKYDAVFSFSAFEYFRDYEYATEVLERMTKKSNHTVAILDVHDLWLRDKWLAHRRALIPNYDERYRNLDKLFYDKDFFLRFADHHGLDIKFTSCRIEGYWNAPFTYDVYFYRR